MTAEVAASTGSFSVAGFGDFQAFYDTVDWRS